MNDKPTLRLVLPALAIVAAALITLKACSKPAPPPPEPRLLVVDGLTITFEDLQPFVDYIRSFRPEAGTKSITMKALDEHVLPLRLAQRAFAEEREAQHNNAQALSDVADNVYDLENFTENTGHKQRKKLARMQAHLPVSMFVFDPLKTGAVSPPLELPQGWFVVASYDMVESPLAVADHVDVLQVAFVTHDADQWALWYDEEKRRITDKVTFVHPDYAHRLPPWLNPPKKP